MRDKPATWKCEVMYGGARYELIEIDAPDCALCAFYAKRGKCSAPKGFPNCCVDTISGRGPGGCILFSTEYGRIWKRVDAGAKSKQK